MMERKKQGRMIFSKNEEFGKVVAGVQQTQGFDALV